MMNSTEIWILDRLLENSSAEHSMEESNLKHENYFEIGLIDSLGILTLIDQIESEFEIQLSHEHFEQRRFSTIAGLAEIIEEEKMKHGSL